MPHGNNMDEKLIKEKDTVSVKFGNYTKQYPVIKDPVPHILIDSKKELHGWYEGVQPYGHRECTAERLLINPYNGCTHDCVYCYAHALMGYFALYREEKVITVFKDFDRQISAQLDEISIASCGYLSPVTDPFQPINKKYQLTEKIIKEFVDRNIPIEVITKNKISDKAINLMKQQKHSFGQVSIITLSEDLRKKLSPGSASIETLLNNLERLSENNIFAVCRIDPIIPYITDDKKDLKELVSTVVKKGANHLIVSCMDIPRVLKQNIERVLSNIKSGMIDKINFRYLEAMKNDIHAEEFYRRGLFHYMKDLANENKVTMSLCMEYELTGIKEGRIPYVKGLNRHFMTSKNCEGIDTPLYKRNGNKFYPINCKGACLTCDDNNICGIIELSTGGKWKLVDYKNWSKKIRFLSLNNLVSNSIKSTSEAMLYYPETQSSQEKNLEILEDKKDLAITQNESKIKSKNKFKQTKIFYE